MLFYLITPLLAFFLGTSCKKDPVENNTLVFPKTYVYNSYSTVGLKIYVKSGVGFTEINPAGSFASYSAAAQNEIVDFKEFLAFNEINLLSSTTSNLSNTIPGHDYFGLSVDADYINQAGNLTFTLKSGNQTAELWSTLADNDITLLQYVKCTTYSYVKPDNTIGYSPFDFIPTQLPDFNLGTSTAQSVHTFQPGDTLAVLFLAGKFN